MGTLFTDTNLLIKDKKTDAKVENFADRIRKEFPELEFEPGKTPIEQVSEFERIFGTSLPPPIPQSFVLDPSKVSKERFEEIILRANENFGALTELIPNSGGKVRITFTGKPLTKVRREGKLVQIKKPVFETTDDIRLALLNLPEGLKPAGVVELLGAENINALSEDKILNTLSIKLLQAVANHPNGATEQALRTISTNKLDFNEARRLFSNPKIKEEIDAVGGLNEVTLQEQTRDLLKTPEEKTQEQQVSKTALEPKTLTAGDVIRKALSNYGVSPEIVEQLVREHERRVNQFDAIRKFVDKLGILFQHINDFGTDPDTMDNLLSDFIKDAPTPEQKILAIEAKAVFQLIKARLEDLKELRILREARMSPWMAAVMVLAIAFGKNPEMAYRMWKEGVNRILDAEVDAFKDFQKLQLTGAQSLLQIVNQGRLQAEKARRELNELRSKIINIQIQEELQRRQLETRARLQALAVNPITPDDLLSRINGTLNAIKKINEMPDGFDAEQANEFLQNHIANVQNSFIAAKKKYGANHPLTLQIAMEIQALEQGKSRIQKLIDKAREQGVSISALIMKQQLKTVLENNIRQLTGLNLEQLQQLEIYKKANKKVQEDGRIRKANRDANIVSSKDDFNKETE